MKKLLIAASAALAVGVMAAPAQAQARFGVQANIADDADFGIGVRGQFGLGEALNAEGGLSDLIGVVSFDFYPDCGPADCTYWEINGNALYPVRIEGSELAPYFGGGLNIAHISFDSGVVGADDVSDTDLGLNVLGGLNLDLGGLGTFVEAKIELGGGEQFVLTFGALFGGG